MPGGLPEVVQKFSADSAGYSAAIAAMIKDNEALVKSIDDAKRKIKELAGDLGGLGDKRVKVEVAGVAEAIAGAAELRKALDGIGDKPVRVDVDAVGALARIAEVRAAAAALGDAPARLRVDAADALARIAEVRAAIAGLGDAHAAVAVPDAGVLADVMRGHAEAADAAAAAVRKEAAAVRKLGRDIRDLHAAAAPGGGGAGLAVAAAAAGGAAGGGGAGAGAGGGGMPGGAGSFVPWRGGGFQAVKFWGMAIAEFAATAVPALIAAGSAAAVGMQGAQDVMLRAKAIGAASESIGPAFGQSTSSYLGLPGTLSGYQDQARGGVYELGGAAINFARMGKGTFGQMGMNTLSMIDRGSANMLLNYQARQAAGGGLGDLLGGGTEWLRRYGDLGANIGNTVMNLAPYEPGIGGDVLNTLVGGTGFLKQMTQDIPGPILGAIMAGEGGMRWSKALLGGKGLLGRVLGLGKVGGLGGLLTKGGEGLFARGAGGVLGDLGLGMVGAGGALAEFGGPIGIAAALGGYEISALSSYKDSAQRHVGALQTQVGNAGFSAAFTPLAKAIVATTGLAGAVSPIVGVGTPVVDGRRLPGGRVGAGIQAAQAISDKNVFTAAASGFTAQMTDLLRSGPQVLDILHKAGMNSVSMAQGFQIAQNSLLDLNHAFDAHGKLNATAQQQLKNYVSAIGPMTRSGGGFNAAIEAQQIMSSPAMKSLSQVNQAMDSMTQIMTGGPAGMATLFGMLGGAPITHKLTKAGLQLQAPPAFKKMAQALTSFTTPGGAAAWNTFAGSQGFIAAEQQNLDQLRTSMTLGALSQPQAAGLAGFQIQQMLPMAKKSPAALAMLMQQEQQMGIGGYYDPAHQGESQAHAQARNYQDAVKATAQIADNSRQANAATNHQVVALSRLPVLAKQFSQGFSADVMSNQVAAAASSFSKVTSEAMKGAIDKGAIGGLTGQLKTAFGGNMSAVRAQIQQALSTSGLSAGTQKKIMVQVDANTGPAQAKISAIHGKMVQILAHGNTGQVQSAINAIHGKTVQVVIQAVMQGLPVGMGAMQAAGFAPGVAASTIAAGIRKSSPGHAAGYKVPGYGGGDRYPAMLEGGEAVVPKHLVPALAGFLGGHGVPGFAGGGFVGQQVTGPLSYWGAGSSMAMWNPAMYAQLLAAMEASQGQGVFARPQGFRDGAGGGSMAAVVQAAAAAAAAVAQHSGGGGGGSTAGINLHGMAPAVQKVMGELIREIGKSGIGREFSVSVVDGIRKAITTGAAANALKSTAQALVSKLQQEVSYAKGTATSMQQGLNLGGMNLDPATGNGPVQTQMQSYAGSMQSFLGDLKTVRKGHLNKDLISQMVAAGPVQGDALAQSILGGPGGIKGANQLDNQIGKLSRAIGAQAAMAQYGGYLSPDLKNATVVGKGGVAVNISVNAGKSGSLDLTKEQIAAIVAQVQAALLKQAKRNTKTGTKLPGKSS